MYNYITWRRLDSCYNNNISSIFYCPLWCSSWNILRFPLFHTFRIDNMSVNEGYNREMIGGFKVLLAMGILPVGSAFAGANVQNQGTLQCDAQYSCLKALIDSHYSTFDEVQLQYRITHLYTCYIFLFQWSYMLWVCAYVINSPTHEWSDIRYRLAFHLRCGVFFSLSLMAVLFYKHVQLQ
jgi:hypothetical protein